MNTTKTFIATTVVATTLLTQPSSAFFDNAAFSNLVGEIPTDLFNMDLIGKKESSSERRKREHEEISNYSLPEGVDFDNEEQNAMDIEDFNSYRDDTSAATDYKKPENRNKYLFKDKEAYDKEFEADGIYTGFTQKGMGFLGDLAGSIIDSDGVISGMGGMADDLKEADSESMLSNLKGANAGLYSDSIASEVSSVYDQLNPEFIAKALQKDLVNNPEFKANFLKGLEKAKADGKPLPEWMNEKSFEDGTFARRMGNTLSSEVQNSKNGIIKNGKLDTDFAKREHDKLNEHFVENKDEYIDSSLEMVTDFYGGKDISDIVSGKAFIKP